MEVKVGANVAYVPPGLVNNGFVESKNVTYGFISGFMGSGIIEVKSIDAILKDGWDRSDSFICEIADLKPVEFNKYDRKLCPYRY